MGAGSQLLDQRASARLVEIKNERDRQDTLFGRDAPTPTLIRWRGNLWQDLSWADCVQIMSQAETSGATEVWARLTRRMYQDGHLLAQRGTRLDPISGAPFDVEAGGPDPIDQLAADDVAFMLKSLPDLPTILDGILDGIFVGWSVAEIIWEPRGAWIWPESIETLQPHRFRFTTTMEPYLYDDGRLGNSQSRNTGVQLNGMALSANKYIVHMPRAIPDYPIAAGLLRACTRYWWPKWEGIKSWLGGAEVAGNPRAIGKYAGSPVSSTSRNEFFTQLQNLSALGVMVIDKDDEVEILDAAARDGSIWDGIQKWADNGMTKAVLGSTLNSEVGDTGGNRALGESQGQYTIDPRLVKDSTSLWATIRRDLVRPFLEFNALRYGGRKPALPIIKSRFHEELEPKVDALLVSIGVLTNNDVLKAYGHPEISPERGGDAIAKVAPPAGGFGGAFSQPAGSLAQTGANTDYLPAGGAAAARPFRLQPWEAVERMSREAE